MFEDFGNPGWEEVAEGGLHFTFANPMSCSRQIPFEQMPRTKIDEAQEMFDREKAPPLPKNQLGFLQFATWRNKSGRMRQVVLANAFCIQCSVDATPPQ